MIYILIIWTVVGVGGTQISTHVKHDWRPLGEFRHSDIGQDKTALQMCEDAAKQLGLKSENYRCVRSK